MMEMGRRRKKTTTTGEVKSARQVGQTGLRSVCCSQLKVVKGKRQNVTRCEHRGCMTRDQIKVLAVGSMSSFVCSDCDYSVFPVGQTSFHCNTTATNDSLQPLQPSQQPLHHVAPVIHSFPSIFLIQNSENALVM